MLGYNPVRLKLYTDVTHAGDQVALGGRVLAQFRRDAHEFHLRHRLQAFADLQTRGAVLAVDENLGLVAAGHGLLSHKLGALGRADWRRRE